MSIFLKRRYIFLGLIAAILVVLPHFLSPSHTHILIYTMFLILLCSAWNISASAGQFSLLHSVFLGAGGYMSIVLYNNLGVSPWLGILAGMLTAAILALSLGWVCLRAKLPVLSFAIFTLALAHIVESLVSIPRQLGSNDGLTANMLMSPTLWDFQFMSKIPYYYIILIMTVITLVICKIIFSSKPGFYFRAIHDNPDEAEAIGVNTLGWSLRALTISAILWAAAGTFWAQYLLHVDPPTFIGVHMVIVVILITVIGGIGTFWGPVIAPAIMVPLGEILRAELGTVVPGLNWILYGAIVVAILLSLKKGIVPWWTERRRKKAQAV